MQDTFLVILGLFVVMVTMILPKCLECLSMKVKLCTHDRLDVCILKQQCQTALLGCLWAAVIILQLKL